MQLFFLRIRLKIFLVFVSLTQIILLLWKLMLLTQDFVAFLSKEKTKIHNNNQFVIPQESGIALKKTMALLKRKFMLLFFASLNFRMIQLIKNSYLEQIVNLQKKSSKRMLKLLFLNKFSLGGNLYYLASILRLNFQKDKIILFHIF